MAETRGLCGLRLDELPPVSTVFAVFQALLFCFRESWLGIFEKEDVHVSWDLLVNGGQWHRLLYAHFFHFTRVHIFVNCVTLLTTGNKLEKKIRRWSFILLILAYGILTNLLYVFLTRFVCIMDANHQFTYGFTWVVFGLRVVDILLQDEWSWKEDPTLVYGIFPVFLPLWLTVWWPLVETVFFDNIILERCIIGNISGILVALTIPYVNFGGLISPPHSSRTD